MVGINYGEGFRMPSYAFSHIHLTSPDPEKTADFYEKTFGVKKSVLNIGAGRKFVSLDLNGARIVITTREDGEAEKPSLDHFGIATDNLEQAVTGLKGQGVQFTQEITQFGPRVKYSFFRGPDDVSIELLQP
jgi:lactoylglutathione lyase